MYSVLLSSLGKMYENREKTLFLSVSFFQFENLHEFRKEKTPPIHSRWIDKKAQRISDLVSNRSACARKTVS